MKIQERGLILTLAMVGLLVLTAGPANAQSERLGASSLQWSAGSDLQGSVPVMEMMYGPFARFSLSAESLRIETDANFVDVQPVVQEHPETTIQEAGKSTVEGQEARVDARMFIHASRGAKLVAPDLAGCGAAQPPVRSAHVYQPFLSGRPTLRVPLDDAVRWEPCGDGTVTLHGDFIIALWEWDAELRSSDGTTMLQSGRGDPTAGDLGSREQFLFATNATLRLPPGKQVVYLRDLSVSTGSAHLDDAEGEVAGRAVSGALELEGDLRVQIQGQGANAPLQATIDGITAASIDGQTLVVPGAPAGGVSRWPWLLLVLAAPVVGIAYARPHLHYFYNERNGGELGSLVPKSRAQRRGVGVWIMARKAERRGWFWLSFRRATRANNLFRPFPEAQFTRAVAAGHLGRHADAMTDFLDLYNRHDEPMGRAAAACGIAQECCRMERWANGKEWLLIATTESFEYAHQASIEPEFDHFQGEPWFDAMRRGRNVVPAFEFDRGDPSVH